MNPSFRPDFDHELLIRFLSGEASVQERQQVQEWVEADHQHQEYVKELTLLWQSSASAKDFAAIDVGQDWQKVKTRINVARHEGHSQPIHPTYAWWDVLLKIAAVVLLLLGTAIGVSPTFRQVLFSSQPGAMAVTGPVAITLADGTNVYLNKDAHLTYPASFRGQNREVALTGEAFFEVAKNKHKPFVIQSGAVVTRVLGTSFNVNASSQDSVLVTVLSGKVALFEIGKQQNPLTITPGERGTYRKGTLTKARNTDQNFLAWKTGVLAFQNTPLPEVIRELNRYYHQPIQLQTKGLETCRLSSTFRQQTLEEVLAEMQLVLPVQVVRKGNTIIITGEGCR